MNGRIKIKSCYKMAVFVMLFYCYNYSLAINIYRSKLAMAVSFLVAVIFAAIPILSVKKFKFDKYTLLWATGFLIALLHNQRLADGDYDPKMLFWFAGIICMLFLKDNEDWIVYFVKSVFIYTIGHIFFCWLFKFMPGFYLNHIIPMFDSTSQVVLYQYFSQGFLTGLTAHYSTIAIYIGNGLVIEYALLLTETVYMKQRNLKIFMFITALTLIMTGKRGMIIFSIITMLIFTLIYRARSLRKAIPAIFKILGVVLTAALLVVVLANTVLPELLSTLNRFIVSDGQDVTSGRVKMWALAIELFLNHPLYGIGWYGYRLQYSVAWEHGSVFQTLDVHNVYLQLLCETGLVGFVIFVSAIMIALYGVIKDLRICLFRKREKMDNNYIRGLAVSCCLQIVFVLYCFTGNPLYDAQTSVIYFFSIAAWLAIRKKMRTIE